MFYLGSLALFGISATLIRGASPYSQSGCFAFEKKRKHKLVGQILLVMAIFALGIAVLAQFFSTPP
jgi:uncharacterized membrane protein